MDKVMQVRLSCLYEGHAHIKPLNAHSDVIQWRDSAETFDVLIKHTETTQRMLETWRAVSLYT